MITMPEPENLVHHILREMRDEMRDMRSDISAIRSDMATKQDLVELRSEVHSLRANVASDLIDLEKRVNDQFVTLRRSVMEYHSTAVGHGMLYSELEERVRRIEQRLDINPSEAH